MSEFLGTSKSLSLDFVSFAIQSGVLKFGQYTTKAGRESPYFFNAGLFDDGLKISKLASFYAQCVLQSGIEFDMIFGPAYKGIPLGATLAMELARMGKNVPFAYNRKEIKDHGEGGSLVGAPLRGRVLIVDDVMSAGTAVRESIELIKQQGATPHSVVIALDRQEMATEKQNGVIQDVPYSAVQYVKTHLGLQVCSVASLEDLLSFLSSSADSTLQAHLAHVEAYRSKYGVSSL
jgi:orotate phosphoribosyltransferase